jgi:YD repeat-containing protein
LYNDAAIEQYEVDLRSGLFMLRRTDLFIRDNVPLSLTRAYRLWDKHSRAFGTGGNQPYDIFPIGDRFPYTYMNLILADGTAVHYNRISKGTSYNDFVAEHIGTTATIFQNSRVRWNIDHWDLTFENGTVFQFPEAYRAKRGVDGALIAMRDLQGNEIRFVRDRTHTLKSITSPHSHQINFAYDPIGRIIEASDDLGDILTYSYDDQGRLCQVNKNGHLLWRYSYDTSGLTSVQDEANRYVLVNEYSRGRIASISLGKKKTYHLDYFLAGNGKVVETIVTDPEGARTFFRF